MQPADAGAQLASYFWPYMLLLTVVPGVAAGLIEAWLLPLRAAPTRRRGRRRRVGRQRPSPARGDVTKYLKVVLVAVLLTGVAMLALPAVWAQSEAGGDHCDSTFLGGDERTAPDVQPLGWSWWPPGMRCRVTPNGRQPQERVAPLL